MKNINKLKEIIQRIILEQGKLSRIKTGGMGTNHPFTVKSQKQSLGSSEKYIEDDKDPEVDPKEKVKVSKVFLK